MADVLALIVGDNNTHVSLGIRRANDFFRWLKIFISIHLQLGHVCIRP